MGGDPIFWFDWPGPGLAVPAAVLLALPFLIAGAVIEARHYRRLKEAGIRLAHLRLLTSHRTSPSGEGGLVALGLVTAAVTLAPPPLGRIMVLIRRVIGGRIDLYHRLADRARREALLRLREQVAALGGDGAVGVRLNAMTITAKTVSVQAVGVAVRGLPPGPGPGNAAGDGLPGDLPGSLLTDGGILVDEAASPPAPRKRALLILIIGGAAAAGLAGLGEVALFWLGEEYPGLKRWLSRWFVR
ncbi:MAG: hypothetical protein RLY86_900 [Pseudomonadota bacterium]